MLEWNPNDPDTVKVHYDVSGWTLDQRAELSESLAEADLAHIWEGDELVVPEELEADTDALFAELEAALGPFPVGLDAADRGVEYGLDEWPGADRQALTAALIEEQIPHRWDGSTAIVGSDHEARVDELLDAIEEGTLTLAGADAAGGPPEGVLERMFGISDRLAKEPDGQLGAELIELNDTLDVSNPPYGVPASTWSRILKAATRLGALYDGVDPEPSDVIEAAQTLRSSVRELI